MRTHQPSVGRQFDFKIKKMVNCKPIKDMNKTNKGNRTPRNENQKRAATLYMILHNPMFNEESRRKSAEARKGKRQKNHFQRIINIGD
jgi:hypothetical protein